jgi:hypothetical protein
MGDQEAGGSETVEQPPTEYGEEEEYRPAEVQPLR